MDEFPENKLHKIFPTLKRVHCLSSDKQKTKRLWQHDCVLFYHSFLFIEGWGTANVHRMWWTFNHLPVRILLKWLFTEMILLKWLYLLAYVELTWSLNTFGAIFSLSRSNTLMHPLWIHRSRAEYSYLKSYFSLQSTLKLPKFSISTKNYFLTFQIYC